MTKKHILSLILVSTCLIPAGLVYSQGYEGEGTGINPNSVYTPPSASKLSSIKTDYNLLTSDLPGFESGVVKVDGFSSYLQKIFNLAIGAAAALAVIMFIVGGFQYMTGDSIGMKSDGSSRMQNAIYGLLLVMAAYLGLYTINPQLLKFDFKIKEVQSLPSVNQASPIIPPPAGTSAPVVGGGTTETAKGRQERVTYKTIDRSSGQCPQSSDPDYIYAGSGGGAFQCGSTFNEQTSVCCEYRLK
ncbi:MAG: pilin [Patescibacteria group bacterium]